MSKQDNQQEMAQRFKQVEALRDKKAFTVTVGASSSIESLTEALTDEAGAVTINALGGTIYYQCDGTDADANAFTILEGQAYTAYGHKNVLDEIRLFASSVTAGIIIHITQ